MTFESDSLQPPRIAHWLVNLFTPAEEAESILGDLLEEFSHLALNSGVAFARSWYWRQAVRTIAHLAGKGFRAAPWSTAVAVALGFLLLRLGYKWEKQAIDAVLDRYQVYEFHYDALVGYWITRGMLIGRVIVAAMVGGIVAFAAKGREMTATVTIGLIQISMAIMGALMNFSGTGDYGFLWTMPWMFAFATAVIAGGAFVRTRRSASRRFVNGTP